MAKLDVQIVEMEPMRVISALGFGPSPEEIAWDKILAFARDQGLDLKQARFFGFNNPYPSPGSPNYGYEQWMTVGPEVEATGDLEIKEIPARRYAATQFQVGTDRFGYPFNCSSIFRCSGNRTVQINDVDPFGTGIDILMSDFHRIIRVDCSVIHTTLF